MRLNGWRRLGIALVGAWVVGCSALAIFETVYAKPLAFTYSGPPPGTVVDTNKGTITLPSGKTVRMWETAGSNSFRDPYPWEINWADYPEVPLSTRIEWSRFVQVSLLIPLVLWVLAEIGLVIVRWVIRGFAKAGTP